MRGAYTLGIAYGYHDASAALVRNGKLIFSTTEDRLSRQKHDPQFPFNAVEACFDFAGITARDLQNVAFHEDPYEKFTRILCSNFAAYPRTHKEFASSMVAWLKGKLWPFHDIAKHVGVDPAKIVYFNHHYSHAMTGFLGSGFKDAVILVVDAVGDWATTSAYHGDWKDGKPQFRKLFEVQFPHSLGLMYSAFTEYLGFRPNDSECSTMALSAFGQDRFHKEVQSLLEVQDGQYRVRQDFFHFLNYSKGAVTDEFVKLFGPSRNAMSRLRFSSWEHVPDDEHQRHADVAASLQAVYTEELLKLAQKAFAETPSSNLCLVGGGAMNCVAASSLTEQSPFKNYYIPPDPGDGGSSIGVALYTNHVENNFQLNPQDLKYTPYMGSMPESQDALAMIEHLDTRKFLRFEKRVHDKGTFKKWSRHDGDAVARVAQYLLAGKSVGYVHGASEIGPRALGHRSILVRPDSIEVAKKLSASVKKRAAFRPYAISILPECAERALELHAPMETYKWMQFTARVQPAYREKLRAACHIDGTTRPHICYQEDNPEMYALLREIKKHAGLGALLNTSFNESGFPLVATAYDAMVVFARTGLDVLVLDDTVLEKEDYYVVREAVPERPLANDISL